MSKLFRVLARMAASGALVFLARTAPSQVLYDNTTGNQGVDFNYVGLGTGNSTAEAGNEIVLAGSSANDLITGFSFQFDYIFAAGTAPLGPTATADVTFYENNGPSVPKTGSYASPGTVLWSSGSFPLGAYTSGGLAVFDAADLGGGVVVPKDFTWTVSFAGLSATDSAGLALYSPPTVGANYQDAWYNPGSGWQLDVATSGNPPLEFGAEFDGTPVPDSFSWPISIAAVMAGFAWMKRHQRRG